jgi:hypothetical protein
MDVPEMTFSIEAKMIGKRSPLQAPWQMMLPSTILPGQSSKAQRPFRLRDLIAFIVQNEVHAFHQRRLLRVLGPQEIADAAPGGKIVISGAFDSVSPYPEQKIDEQTALAAALQAFEDGLYFVFLDGIQYGSLEDEVRIEPGSLVTFIRLVALVGG